MPWRALSNLLMLVLVLALVAVLLWGPDPAPPPRDARLGGPAPGEVERIAIVAAGRETVELRRGPGGWRIAAAREPPADALLVERLLALPASASHARYAAAELDLPGAGLQPPRLTVSLGGVEYRFGAQEPLNRYRYVQADGSVHLITDTLYHQLGGPPEGYADRRLLPEDRAIRGLRAGDWALAQRSDGAWHLDPPRAGVTADEVNRWVERWRLLRALGVERHREQNAAPAIELTLEGRPEPVRVLVLATEPELLLARPDLGLRYRLPTAQAAALLHPPEPAPPGGPAGTDPGTHR